MFFDHNDGLIIKINVNLIVTKNSDDKNWIPSQVSSPPPAAARWSPPTPSPSAAPPASPAPPDSGSTREWMGKVRGKRGEIPPRWWRKWGKMMENEGNGGEIALFVDFFLSDSWSFSTQIGWGWGNNDGIQEVKHLRCRLVRSQTYVEKTCFVSFWQWSYTWWVFTWLFHIDVGLLESKHVEFDDQKSKSRMRMTSV